MKSHLENISQVEEDTEEMLEGKAVIQEIDMRALMQAQATASRCLHLYEISDSITIAAHIKKVINFFFFFFLSFSESGS